jgi:hypothetical protein
MKTFIAICLALFAVSSSAQQPARQRLTRAEIKKTERALSDLGYWTGPVDGILDRATTAGVIAFQKYAGRAITGKLTADEAEEIRATASSKIQERPRARETGYAHVEVDVDRQVMLIVDELGQVKVLPVSTGSEQPFQDHGQMSIAHTPRGRFLVYDKVDGWEKNPPSAMYYSNYISGGVAIHGYPSVPNKPASHGCIRVPIFAAREVSQRMPLGTIVLVYDNVSFVSAREWVENPKLKEAAWLSNAFMDESSDVAARPPVKIRIHRGD